MFTLVSYRWNIADAIHISPVKRSRQCGNLIQDLVTRRCRLWFTVQRKLLSASLHSIISANLESYRAWLVKYHYQF